MSDEIIRITESDMDDAAQIITVASPNPVKNSQLADWDPDQQIAVSKEAIDIVLCVDTSGSMEAADYPPNRLEAAKQAALAFTQRKVTQNYSDRVGIIGFGGSASIVHPLDRNLEKVAVSISRLKITHTGTMIGIALQLAQKELLKNNGKKRAIVLLSDGGDDFDTSNPTKIAGSQTGIKIFTIGIGTIKGAQVNLPTGIQNVTLNENLLKQIAKLGGGEYLYAPDVPQLQQIYLKLADY